MSEEFISKQGIKIQVGVAIAVIVVLISCTFKISSVISKVEKHVELNTYRIGQVEKARMIAWDKYEKNCEKSLEMFKIFGDDLVSIKIKLGIED